ncbi:MAG: aldehyde dehydrogenase [Rhodobacteraceae bacterium]|nr:MAG: aldehyde dehydrogenase [Paracoccaceae bacterium]
MTADRVRAALAGAALALAGAAAAEDDYGGLPEGEGREWVYFSCQHCHSLRTVTNQRFSRRVWDEVLDWMVEEQGMVPLDPEIRAEILDYLAEALGAEG